MRVVDIIFFTDILKLPKQSLKDICTDLRLESTGSSFDLASRIHEYIRLNNNEALNRVQSRLLAGKTSVTWFLGNQENIFENVLEKIYEISPNLENNIEHIPTEQITTDPRLIAIAQGMGNKIYLRFIYNSSVRREVNGLNVNTVAKTEITTVLIDTGSNILEIRTESKKAARIASAIATLLGEEISFEQITVLNNFDNNVELIANALEGELIDATSTPELNLENLNREHTTAMLDILNALNSFFEEEDEEALLTTMRDSLEIFDDHILTVPFTALILNGMEKVGLRVNEGDLRNHPLYETLSPHLLHQGGFIKFNVTISGVEQSFTIRVGITTNSIYFTTPAMEEVITFVNERVVNQLVH